MKTKSYPQMQVRDFVTWVTELIERFADADHEFIFDQLCNNENSSDAELRDHLIDNDTCPDFVTELITMREYFWDFRYCQHINL